MGCVRCQYDISRAGEQGGLILKTPKTPAFAGVFVLSGISLFD
jgi:hypothetical protein